MARRAQPNDRMRTNAPRLFLALVAALLAAPDAAAQTTVTGGTTTDVADPAAIGPTLDFVAGDGTPGTLNVLAAGTGQFTGTWTMNNAFGVFNLAGFNLTILPTVPDSGSAFGDNRLGVTGGTLTLGAGSFLAGWGQASGGSGVLRASGGGSFVIEDGRWLDQSTGLNLEGAAGTRTLTYAGAGAASFDGTLTLSGAAGTQSTIAVGAGAGTLSLVGGVIGAGDLRITADDLGTTVNLGLTQGAPGDFTGRTILDSASVNISTQDSVGGAGLTLIGAVVTMDAALPTLSIGASQTFAVLGASSITGTAPGAALNVTGEMQGDGTLTVANLAMTVGGSTSGFTGDLTLGAGSSLATSNAAWLAGLGTLTFDAATTVDFTGTSSATFDGPLVLNANATFRTSGVDAASLTVSGFASGAGNLTVGAAAGSTARVVLGLSGSFDGLTVIDGASATIVTQASIGSLGLRLTGADLAVGTALSIGLAQTLDVQTASTISGAGAGSSLTLTGEMIGAGALTVDGLALTVNGSNASFSGGVSLEGGSSLTVSNADWLATVGTVSMNADGAATSFTWSGAAAGAFAGTLNLGAGANTVSSTAEDFSLTGTVAGTGDLVVTRQAGSGAEIGLGFTAGSFTGTTVVSSTDARLLTAQSIGSLGLTLSSGALALDAGLPTPGSLTIAAGQTLTVNGASSITGTGGAAALAIDGAMAGSGTLSLTDIAMTVSDGATSAAFGGGVTLQSGSSLAVANSGWMDALSALTFGVAATVDYTDDVAADFGGALTLTDDATIRTSGAAALTLSGTVSGAGDLTLAQTAPSATGFTLALGGSFTGATIVNDANVTIGTQGSVGTAGLQLNDAGGDALIATVGTSLVLADAQSLTIAGEVDLAGSGAGRAIDAQGGLLSAAAATLNLDNLALTVGDGTASTFTGDITLTEGASLILDGADLSGADLSSVLAGDAVTFGGIGSIGAIGSVADPFSGSVELGDLGVSASSVLSVAGDARLAAAAILQSHFLESSGATGTADLLSVAGSFDAGDATANLVFDPGVFTGTWIPGIADTVTYTFVTAAGGLGGSTFGTVNVVTIDPLTGLSTVRPLDQDGETQFLGGAFDVLYGTDSFAVSIRGVGGPAPLPPGGSTDTNVIVPVQVGSTTVNRNANVGIVSNSRINSSVDAMNALLLDPSTSADAQFVATQLLLQTDAPAYASAVTAVSAPTNPNALPTSLMLGMFDAGDVSMRRLMQLRPRAGAAPGALATQDRRQRPWERGTAASAAAPPVAVPRRQAFGPEIYGPTPDEGIRGWARGFGWTGSFSNQSWAQTSYDTVLGSAIAGADVSLGGGAIVGAFVGYMPGSVDITGGLVDESMTVNGVDFGVYGSWSPGDGSWYLAGSGAGTWAAIDRTRTLYVPGAVRTADSSSNAWVASLMGETGWNLWLGGDTYLDPYVRAGFGYFNQGSYTETGAGSMNLAVGDQQAYALQPSLGARFMHGIRSGGSVITPYVGGAFTAIVPVGDWDVTATNAFSGLPSMGVYGSPDTQYGGSMEAGVEWALPNGFTFFAAFNGMFLSDVQVYGGSAGIVVPF